MRFPSLAVVGLCFLGVLAPAAIAAAQPPASDPAAPAAPSPQQVPSAPQEAPSEPTSFKVTVVGTTPLSGVELPAEQIPAPVQTATSEDLVRTGALALSDLLNARFNAVHINEAQNNPFQPDVSYRGYTASPLLGTPQGLSVYMDGVRLNQPFGEVVSWDLVPRIAIESTTLMPGSNPLFGLNTLGGALALQTKNGRSHRGTSVQASYGSNVRRALEFEHGGATANQRLHWYVGGLLFDEDGWRDTSPSDVGQIFGKAGWGDALNEIVASVSHADNHLLGNGLQDFRLLDRDYSSIYTKPDVTDNRSTLATLSSRRQLTRRWALTANVYYRDIRTDTLNGDINEEALDQSLYQPGAAERAALAAAGYGSIPDSGLDAGNTPFPSLRCIGNALLNDEPSEKCNGLINQTATRQRNGGASGQTTYRGMVRTLEHVFTAGAAFDRSAVRFLQSTELGYLNPDRSVTGVGAFGDGGLTGGNADGEPYDTRVNLRGRITTWSLYATDTLRVGPRTHLTLSGRFNQTRIGNRDGIVPGGGAGSLDGDHTFSRFNPAAGATIDLPRSLNLYGGYSEGSRAATSIELGCADPESPCKLPNAMAGDPPLDQVVTRSIEAGVRGGSNRLTWNAGLFRAMNSNDILFVLSDRTGFGYFRNFGRTRRAGVELGARTRVGRAEIGAGYTFLAATFQSAERLNGESNSSNDEAVEGEPGFEGAIDVAPGDRLPFIPQHMFKLFGDVRVTGALGVTAGLIGAGSSYARGNENNRHEPDGTYYLGDGTAPGYAIVNLGARYDLTPRLQLIAQINNVFDRRYSTGAQLGPAGFTEAGTFIARPLPAVGGEFPMRHTTFLAPGAPARGWAGVRVHF